jgi:hypothetical protein
MFMMLGTDRIAYVSQSVVPEQEEQYVLGHENL